MIKCWSDEPEDRPTFEELVASLVRLCPSTGGLNHHDHILDAIVRDTVEDSDTASQSEHSDSPTTNPMTGRTENEYVES